MKRIMLLCGCLLLATTAAGATLSHQGVVSQSGISLTGDHDVTFALFADSLGGSAVWSEGYTLTFWQGRFSAQLGRVNPLPTQIHSTIQTWWLETTVEGTTLPRQRLEPAHAATYADSARVSGTSAPGSGLWSTDGTSVWRGSGSLGIGTTQPANTLELRGAAGDQGLNVAETDGEHAGVVLNSNADRGYLQLLQGGSTKIELNASPGAPQLFNNGGNIGIGTAAPQASLDIATHSGYELKFSGSGVANILGPSEDFYINAAPGWSLVLGADGIAHQFTIGHRVATMEGDLVLDNAGDAKIYTGWGAGDQDRYVMLLNSRLSENASGLKAGGILVADTYSYASPGPNDLVVKGAVAVGGSLSVSGTKCREVDTPQFGKLYFNATEDAHALFTLGGEAQLEHGRASVALAPMWLAGVTIDEAHPLQVWITFYGSHGDYYVERGLTGFVLHESTGSTAPFGWKVEARQKGYEDLYLNRPEPTAAMN